MLANLLFSTLRSMPLVAPETRPLHYRAGTYTLPGGVEEGEKQYKNTPADANPKTRQK